MPNYDHEIPQGGEHGDEVHWSQFYGLVNNIPGNIPLYGARLLVSLDAEGDKQFEFQVDGAAQVVPFELCGFLNAVAQTITEQYLLSMEERNG